MSKAFDTWWKDSGYVNVYCTRDIAFSAWEAARVTDRRLHLVLYSSGYQAGHNDTVEAIYVDMTIDADMESNCGESVTEIINENKL